MIKIDCLRQTIISGNRTYPVFVGFATASDLLAAGDVPAFRHDTSHSDISSNVLTPPVKEWQRPLAPVRVAQISQVFNNSGELMPNPVLLCQNLNPGAPQISIVQQKASGSIPTNIWQLNVPISSNGGPKALWILDGQHRINGLAHSAQSSNHLPAVFLLNEGLAAYSASQMAKVFAQVTTAAEPLDALHHEWLTFSFDLEGYDSSQGPAVPANKMAMVAVAELCRLPSFDSHNNPFWNQIKFNSPLPARLPSGGFSYTCKELKEIIRKFYYSCSPMHPHLPAQQLAKQIAIAYQELTSCVIAPHAQSVFFGDDDHAQVIVQEAYLAGILNYLLHHLPPASWTPVLKNLAFHTTNWNFKSWTKSLSGAANSISKRVVVDVFTAAFRSNSLPPHSLNLVDFLRGNQASVTIEFSNMTTAGKPSARGRVIERITKGDTKSISVAPFKHVRIAKNSISSNIGKLRVVDGTRPLVEYNLERGEILDTSRHPNPLRLLIEFTHYGGTASQAELDIQW